MSLPSSSPRPSESVHHLDGALTIATAQAQHDALQTAVDSCTGGLVVDLATVDALDSAGVQLLLAAARTIAERGSVIVLRHVPTVVSDVVRLYGLQTLLPHDAADPGTPS